LLSFQPIQAQESFHYLFQYDGALIIKMSVLYGLVPSTILTLGTEQHFDLLAEFGKGNVCNKENAIIINILLL